MQQHRDQQAWNSWLRENPLLEAALNLMDGIVARFSHKLLPSEIARKAFQKGFDAGRGDGINSSEIPEEASQCPQN